MRAAGRLLQGDGLVGGSLRRAQLVVPMDGMQQTDVVSEEKGHACSCSTSCFDVFPESSSSCRDQL